MHTILHTLHASTHTNRKTSTIWYHVVFFFFFGMCHWVKVLFCLIFNNKLTELPQHRLRKCYCTCMASLLWWCQSCTIKFDSTRPDLFQSFQAIERFTDIHIRVIHDIWLLFQANICLILFCFIFSTAFSTGLEGGDQGQASNNLVWWGIKDKGITVSIFCFSFYLSDFPYTFNPNKIRKWLSILLKKIYKVSFIPIT